MVIDRRFLGTISLAAILLTSCGSAPQAPARSSHHANQTNGAAQTASSSVAANTGSGKAGKLPTIRLGFCCITPLALPYYLAQDKGMFAKQGVHVKMQRFLQGSATVGQAIAAGQIDVASDIGGPDNVLRLANKGAKIKMVGVEELLDPVWLYAKPGIKSVADLRGKTVVVGGLGGPVYTYGILMLEHGGLKPTDVHLIQNGNNQQRFALLLSGRAEASTLSIPGAFLAKAHGFHALVYLGNVIKSRQEPWVATDKAIRSKREGLVRFFRAIHESVAYIRAHPARAAAVYARVTKTKQSLALQSVKAFMPYYGWHVNVPQLVSVFRIDKQVGLWKGPLPTQSKLASLVNDSILTAASKP